GPGVAVDRGEFDAEFEAAGVFPFPGEHQINVALRVPIGNVPVDDAVIDHIAAKVAAESDELPLDSILLAVDAQHQQASAGRHGAADVMRRRSAVAKFFPWPRLTTGLA